MTLPAARRTPGYRFNQSFAGQTNVGTCTGGDVYLLGEIVAAGTMSEGDIVGPITTQEEASAAAGAQSILAYMAYEALSQRPGGDIVPIYLVAAAEPGAGVAADGDFTFANNADSDNTLVVRIGGHEVTCLIETGNTPTQSGDALEDAVDAWAANIDFPVTATNAAGVVSIDCTNKGTIGNQITLVVADFGTEGTQTCTASGATLANGTLAPTLTTPLAALDAVDTDYLAVSMIDTTSLETIRQHMVTKGNSTNQLGGIAFFGSRDSVATVTGYADTLHGNGAAQRLHAFSMEGSETWPPAMAAADAVAHGWETDCARPMNGIAVSVVRAPAASYRYTVTEMETLLSHGVTPGRTATSSSTVVQIIRSVVVRQDILDPLDITKIQTMDELRDRCIAVFVANNINRMKLKKTGETIYTNTCVTPASCMSLVKGVCRAMETEDKIQGIESGTLSGAFAADYGGTGRVELTIPEDVVDGAHDIAGDIVLVIG